MKHDIKKLPKWAQKIIVEQQIEIDALKRKVKTLEEMDFIMKNYEWFTIGLHTPEPRTLFLLNKDKAQSVAVIGNGNVLFIGRKKDDFETKKETFESKIKN